ncbi:MAG: CHAD domain-containing protein [Gemmatimonadaceae bacterium]|nr:CHAD domain-containing protein [Gemmatimonadaceae bacterium]
MRELPASLLDTAEPRGIRLVALAMLADAAAARTRLDMPGDNEALHDFRVAVRRLRSWLRAWREVLGRGGPPRAVRTLRRVARSTSGRRDAEVFHAWLETTLPRAQRRHRPGIRWVMAAVDEGRRDGATLDAASIAAFEGAVNELREAMTWYRVAHHVEDGPREVPFTTAMATAVRSHATVFRRRLERIHESADDAAIHRARIAGKRLRYLIEPVTPWVTGAPALISALKAMQDALGGLHDAHVWSHHLHTHAERARVERALRGAASVDEGGARRARRSPPDVQPGVEALTERLLHETRDAFAAWASRWSTDARDTFFAAVEDVAEILDAHRAGGVEIERKYLLSRVPPSMPRAEVWEIEQGYVPGERLVERLRRVVTPDGETWFRTVKSGRGVARVELEEATTPEIFAAMWPLTTGRRVRKRRHRVAEGQRFWEVDEFTDRDLVLAEIELASVDEPVEIPAWLAPVLVRDVTGEPEYVNANLAR